MPGKADMVKLTVRVQPGARKNEVLGFQEDVLRLKIAAPPVEGKANRELIDFLSGLLDVRKSDVTVEKGETSKRKIVAIAGMSKTQIMEKLSARSTTGRPTLL
jgi:uncharacterized protein (TIGR00251 family)